MGFNLAFKGLNNLDSAASFRGDCASNHKR